MQRYGGTWSGDVATGWPGLRASLSLVIGLGLCGVPYSGPDVGGFDGEPSPELYLRWFQLGAYLPLFRTHAALRAGRREPWEFGDEVLGHARVALVERRRLLPYFVTLAHLARRTGAPYVRPVWWSAPEDRALRDCEDAFLLGDSLLVAPVLEPGADGRAVRLPYGRWYDTESGQAHEGPGQVLVDAPLSRVPVFARAGAVIPVRGDDGGLCLEVWAAGTGVPAAVSSCPTSVTAGRRRTSSAIPRGGAAAVWWWSGRTREGRPSPRTRCGSAGSERSEGWVVHAAGCHT